MQVNIYPHRSNQIVIALSTNGAPETAATVQVKIKEDGAVLSGSELTLTNNGDGTYSGKWALFPLKNKSYCLNVRVTVAASPVIDEDHELLPLIV